jgi:hypothetical protein
MKLLLCPRDIFTTVLREGLTRLESQFLIESSSKLNLRLPEPANHKHKPHCSQ